MVESSASKLRVMVDANLLVAGSGWPRFPYEVLEHAVRGDYQLVLTAEIIQEARDALADVLPQQIVRLDNILITSNYEEVPTPTDDEIEANLHLVGRDPKDIHVALAAINAGVDFLITQDRDMTERDGSNDALHEKIDVILPATFLRQYMGWTSEALEAIRKRTWQDMSDLDD